MAKDGGSLAIDIHMLGINHFDPRQPERVALTLRALNSKYGVMPSFAAVEADEQLHQAVSAQKPIFIQLLVDEWPDLTKEEIARMGASFLFEPEAHLEVFDNVPIVWLDSGRSLENHDENHHAKFRLQLIKKWLNADSLHNSLERLGARACEAADPNCVDLVRSQQFYDRIIEELQKYDGSWSFVIVGSAHTDGLVEGTMANLLADNNVTIKRHELC